MTAETVAFVFPGQGSQSIGMLADVAATESLIIDTFAEASDALGYDLWALAQNGPEEQQNLTENTQPLILTASVALWRLWCRRSEVRPAQMAGHSLGEFSALVCADALPFADTVNLVRQRGRFMQSAVPVGVGAMAAIIGLDDEQINNACEQAAGNEVVAAVNYNSPGQVVIAGHAAAVQRAGDLCKEFGAKRAMPLPVSAPFHTALMRPAGEQLAEVLKDIRVQTPSVPVIHNVHAKAESVPEKIRELLVQQISSPVPWVGCVEALSRNGAEHLVECGPGKVLTGLTRRINKSLQGSSLQTLDNIDSLNAALST